MLRLRYAMSVAYLTLGLASAQTLHAQDIVQIDPISGNVVHAGITAGRLLTVRLTGLNTLCYNYSIKVEQHEATFDSRAATELITFGDNNSILGGKVDSSKTTFTIRPPTISPNDSVASRLVSSILDKHNSAILAISAARDFIEMYRLATNCSKPIDATRLFELWRERGDGVADLLQKAITSMHDAGKELMALTDPKAEALARLKEQQAAIDKQLLEVADEFRPVAAHLNVVQASTVSEYSEKLGRNVEAITIKVTRRSLNDSSEATVDRRIPVMRRFRLHFSTGIVATKVSSRHFDRVNRQVVDESGKQLDSTYSTWAHISGDSQNVIAPALFVSASLMKSDGVSVGFSLGTVLRNVNAAGNSLEPMIGAYASILDRIFLHAGLHVGREEVLLLAERKDWNSVADRPVPASVTRSDAVGIRWQREGYFGVSIRLN